MNKPQVNIRLNDDVSARLDSIANYHNEMSKNTLLAIVASELSRLDPNDLWMGLARLTQGAKPLPPDQKPAKARKPKPEHATAQAA